MNAKSAASTAPNPEPLYSSDGYSPEDSVGKLIGMVRAQLMAALDDELADLGLTGAQLPILHWITRTPEATGATLCRCIGTDTGSMTRMLDRLEEKGFIRRIRSREDRRVMHVELTAAGKALRADGDAARGQGAQPAPGRLHPPRPRTSQGPAASHPGERLQ